MNKRTRFLAFVTLGLAGLFVLGLGGRAVILRPLRTIDDQIVQLQLRLQSIQKERTAYLAADTQLRDIGPTLFGLKSAEAEGAVGSLLTALINQAGLRESDFTRNPAGRRRLPGAEEIGWTLQGEGPLAQILDLLFLLQAHPRPHRIDGLGLSPTSEPGRIRIRLRYLTLALNPPPDAKIRLDLASASLESPERRRYDLIAQRDLLRPFQAGETSAPSDSAAPASPGLAEAQFFKLVSLSSWAAGPEAHLLDTRNQTTKSSRPGDALFDGQFVAVDERPLPAAGKPGLLSFSRLIWRVGDEFWAVDTGQTLTDRRRLTPAELPPSLSTNPPAAVVHP